MPDQGPSNYIPPTREENFVAALNKAIKFHQEKTDDAHNISNAVICAISEVRDAFKSAYKIR